MDCEKLFYTFAKRKREIICHFFDIALILPDNNNRGMFFKDVIGQDELKKQLTVTANKGLVPHAWLFCGAEGVGTFELALAYARYLNCSDRSGFDSCGRCHSCVQYNEMAHPDLHFVFPMITQKKPKKEVCDDYLPEWRTFLKSRITQHTYFSMDTWLTHLELIISKPSFIRPKVK